ncbi:MAG: amidohydrolase [Planctomycetes bacterium]|nr:amidohydrolase [Planctomycetota bacterium]
MAIIEDIASKLSEHSAWRHEIHSHPETAFEEIQTGDFVAAKLESFGIEVHRGIGRTGLVGVLKGNKGGEGSIGLRADMDALNLSEMNDFDHKSQHDGKMHACGHDGHTCMLLAAAQHLAANPNFKGRVVFVFQPAEENEGGADVMIKDGLFERFPVDEVYGMHNWPEHEEGVFCVKSGGLMAANDRFDLIIQGKGGHAAMPQFNVDSICLASEVVCGLQHIVSRQVSPMDNVVVSITQIHAGDAYNVIPDTCTICGSIRTLDPELRKEVNASIEKIAQKICEAYGGSAELKIRSGYPVTVNAEDQTAKALAAAIATVGKDKVVTDFTSTMGSEDFSFMLEKVPGCYLFIGNSGNHKGPTGNPCMLHNPYYDFNDNNLPIGASFFVNLIEQLLGQ